MKRIISALVACAIVFSYICIPALAEVSEIPVYPDNPEILFSENFDECSTAVPSGWSANNYGKANAYIQSEYAVEGKACYIKDDTTSDAVVLNSPSFSATPNQALPSTAYSDCM